MKLGSMIELPQFYSMTCGCCGHSQKQVSGDDVSHNWRRISIGPVAPGFADRGAPFADYIICVTCGFRIDEAVRDRTIKGLKNGK